MTLNVRGKFDVFPSCGRYAGLFRNGCGGSSNRQRFKRLKLSCLSEVCLNNGREQIGARNFVPAPLADQQPPAK
jgi:hypothetical protein